MHGYSLIIFKGWARFHPSSPCPGLEEILKQFSKYIFLISNRIVVRLHSPKSFEVGHGLMICSGPWNVSISHIHDFSVGGDESVCNLPHAFPTMTMWSWNLHQSRSLRGSDEQSCSAHPCWPSNRSKKWTVIIWFKALTFGDWLLLWHYPAFSSRYTSPHA